MEFLDSYSTVESHDTHPIDGFGQAPPRSPTQASGQWSSHRPAEPPGPVHELNWQWAGDGQYKKPILEKADLIISYAVMEHTTSPTNFLKSISNILNPNGLVLIGTPHQDRISHDIFFVDHLFHFSSKHIQDIARFANLKLLNKSTKQWPIDSFGIYLFQLSKTKMRTIIKNRKNKCNDSVRFYLNSFKKTDIELEKNRKIAVLGLGEFFSLLNAYTKLKNQKINYGLDDFPKNKKFPFPIIPINKIKLQKIDTIFVCTNPNYYDIILTKIKNQKIKIFLPFQRMEKNWNYY